MSNTPKQILLISDFFVHQVMGGGELNDWELLTLLKDLGHEVNAINSHLVTPRHVETGVVNNCYFIVSNFCNLSEESRNSLQQRAHYIIYEHDHKYLKSRNPAEYNNFLAPREDIVNFSFYQKAATVMCQSHFHAEIVRANLKLDNIMSVAGNLWSLDSLRLMEEISTEKKSPTCAIMKSDNWHKNTSDAIKLCEYKGWEYNLIDPSSYNEFLRNIGKNEKFVFLPKTPETLSRVVVEARMMGLSVVTNNQVGATKEGWFDLKGKPLIEVMRRKREEIPKLVLGRL